MRQSKLRQMNQHQLSDLLHSGNFPEGAVTRHDVWQALTQLQNLAELSRLCRNCQVRTVPTSTSKYCYVTCQAQSYWHQPPPLQDDPHGNLRLAFHDAPTIHMLDFRHDYYGSRPEKRPVTHRWPTVQERFNELRDLILEQKGISPLGKKPSMGRIIGRTSANLAVALICEDVPGGYIGNELTHYRREQLMTELETTKLEKPVQLWATGILNYGQDIELHTISAWPQDSR